MHTGATPSAAPADVVDNSGAESAAEEAVIDAAGLPSDPPGLALGAETAPSGGTAPPANPTQNASAPDAGPAPSMPSAAIPDLPDLASGIEPPAMSTPAMVPDPLPPLTVSEIRAAEKVNAIDLPDLSIPTTDSLPVAPTDAGVVLPDLAEPAFSGTQTPMRSFGLSGASRGTPARAERPGRASKDERERARRDGAGEDPRKAEGDPTNEVAR